MASRAPARPDRRRRRPGAWQPGRTPGVLRADCPATSDTRPGATARSRPRPPTAEAVSGGPGAAHSAGVAAAPGGAGDSAAAVPRYSEASAWPFAGIGKRYVTAWSIAPPAPAAQ